MDFVRTRTIIDALQGWVTQFADRLPQPVKNTLDRGGFRWEHETMDADTLQVTKAVRIASGLRAAMVLADAGHTVECGVILRTVADFSAEIIFIGEGLLEGRFTKEQARSIEQHHAALPATADELAEREREYYVGRKAVAKAHKRIGEKVGDRSQELLKITAFLNKGYDSYVHGSYASAMELFTGRTMGFMMAGTESPRSVCVAKVAVAGKLNEALNALRFMAITRAMKNVEAELHAAFDSIHESGEDAGLPCRDL
jgi:hypothetical protein